MFKTIEEIRKKCTTYFNKDRVEIFGIKVESEVLYGEYFISSCKLHPWFNMKPRLRMYYIAKALDVGKVIGIGEGYTTKRKALIALHSMKEGPLPDQGPKEFVYAGVVEYEVFPDSPASYLIGSDSIGCILEDLKGKLIKLTIEIIPEGG